MTDISLIKRYLPQDLWEFANKFDIPEEFLVDMPEVIEMVLKSKSIDTDEEKQSWFDLMPVMNDEQLDKLKEILLREQKKLQEIESRYEEKKLEIKKKYLLKWQKMGYVNTINKIHQNEEAAKSQEQQDAEKLLEML